MKTLLASWQTWALLSAGFAAMTAILAKLGVQNINANFATFIRTIVVILFLTVIVLVRGEFQSPFALSRRGLLFLVLSGLATGASWLCYFHAVKLGPISQVAPIDKLSLLMVAILGVFVLGERLSPHGWLGIALMAAGAILVGLKR